MAGQFIKVDFKDRSVQRGLRFMRTHRKALAKVFRQLRPILRTDLHQAAEKGVGPSGTWPPRAPSTEARVAKRAGKHTFITRGKAPRARSSKGRMSRAAGPVREIHVSKQMGNLLGKLPVGVTTTARGATLTGRSKVPWAGVHNEGGVVGRGAVIPQREFVFLSPEFLDEATDAMGDAIARGWRKA